MAVVITYHIQFEYRSSPHGDPLWFWTDHHRTYHTKEQAEAQLAEVIQHHESMAGQRAARDMLPFSSGRYRLIERHVETTETVVAAHKVPRGEIRA